MGLYALTNLRLGRPDLQRLWATVSHVHILDVHTDIDCDALVSTKSPPDCKTFRHCRLPWMLPWGLAI